MLRRMAWKWFGLALPVAALTVVGFSSMTFAQDKKDDGKGGAAAAKDIVEVVGADYKTLAELLKAADLEKTLKDKGPFTLFAPTDEAFKKVDKATLDDLKKPENKAKLADLLKNHVLAGKSMAADVAKLDGKTVKSLAGNDLKVMSKDGKTSIEGAHVAKADIAASNGVIHAVDAVIMPAAKAEPKKDMPKKDEPKKDEPKKDEPKKDEKPKTGGGH